jgi:hypothetical protein
MSIINIGDLLTDKHTNVKYIAIGTERHDVGAGDYTKVHPVVKVIDPMTGNKFHVYLRDVICHS